MSEGNDVSKISVVRADITVNPGDSVVLRINNADNEVAVMLNDLLLYDRKTEHDPTFNNQVELGEILKPGLNYLNVIGIDWSAVFHFKFSLDVNGNNVSSFSRDDKGSPGGTKGIQRHYGLSIEVR